jgi:hypothetical protein
MVTTRSRERAETAGVLPLRSRALSPITTFNHIATQTRTLPGGSHISMVAKQETSSPLIPATDQAKRSALAECTTDAAQGAETNQSPESSTLPRLPEQQPSQSLAVISTASDFAPSRVAEIMLPLGAGPSASSGLPSQDDTIYITSEDTKNTYEGPKSQHRLENNDPPADALISDSNVAPQALEGAVTNTPRIQEAASEWGQTLQQLVHVQRQTRRLPASLMRSSRNAVRSSITKNHRGVPHPRIQSSLQQYKAGHLSRDRRRARWPGQKTSFMIAY